MKTREGRHGRAKKKAERGPTLNVDNFTYPKSTSLLVIEGGILNMHRKNKRFGWAKKELYVPVMKGKRQTVVEGYSCGYILPRDPRVPEHVEARESLHKNGPTKVKE